MKDQYILKEVATVTQIAKNIFGDIVHKVYYAEAAYVFVEEKDTIARIDSYIETAQNSDTSIDQDHRSIVIEFTNGHKVIFSNSEWGSMEAFDTSEVKKYV